MTDNKIELYIGIGLLLLAILAFFYLLFTALPNQQQVNAQAQTLPTIPRDLFSADNQLTKAIQSLNTPGNVPVTVNPDNLGRANVFQNF